MNCFLLLACSEFNQKGGDSGKQNDATPLLGVWQGVQKLKSQNPVDEIVRDIRISFSSTNRFRITLLESGEEGEGRFSLFESLQAVTLKYDTGSSESILLSGRMNDFDYEIIDSELLLKSNRQEFKLKRLEDGSVLTLDGVWKCNSSINESQWLLSFSDQTFYMQGRSDDSSDILMTGNLLLDEPFSGLLNEELSLTLEVEKGLPQKVFEKLFGLLVVKSGELSELILSQKMIKGTDTVDQDADLMMCNLSR